MQEESRVLFRMGSDRMVISGEDVVNERLEDVLVPSFNEVVDYLQRFHVNLRTAAYMLSPASCRYNQDSRNLRLA
jgi:glutamate dehydrogenase/leucine dehydrogenase